VSEGLRLLNLCEMVKVAIPEESSPANRANDQVEAERSTDGSGTEPEESDDSSEESEDDIPVYQMMTTMFHVGNDKEEDETAHVTMWKVRIFQEGNNLLGTGSDPTDYGRTVMVFPDSGADAPGANADYVEAVGLAKVPRPRDKWFRIDGAVEGQTSLITIKEDVLLDVYFEGQEYLGTDSKRITSKGDGRVGMIQVRLPVIPGLRHQLIIGNTMMRQHHMNDDKCNQEMVVKIPGEETSIVCPMYPLETACEYVNSRSGQHAKIVRKLPCWKRLTKMVSDNKDRGTCEVCNPLWEGEGHTLGQGSLRGAEGRSRAPEGST
jgi:hypothetical protein